MPKVYCEDCRNFKVGPTKPCGFQFITYQEERELCMAPENFKDTHQEESRLPLSTPKVINRFNDCVWYDPKVPSSESSSSGETGECSFIVDMP
jgi:hypothetical protein